MRDALRCGVSVAEFWAMTPAETFMTVEAGLWQERQQRRQRITQAWLTARLGRVKHMPKLSVLLTDKTAKPLSGAELTQRRQEFREMTENLKNLDPSTLQGQVFKGRK